MRKSAARYNYGTFISDQCAYYAKKGGCKNFAALCEKSCGLCPTPTPAPTPVSADGGDGGKKNKKGKKGKRGKKGKKGKRGKKGKKNKKDKKK